MRSTALVLALVASSAGVARAGPPLLTDDPTTVAPGHLELISAVAVGESGSQTNVEATLLDIAYGLVDTLEVDLVVGLVSRDDDEASVRFQNDGAPLALAAKWEPLRSEWGSVALAPSFSFELEDGDNITATIPLLTELRSDWARVGASGEFLFRDDARDGWRTGVYGGIRVGESSEVLAEVIAQALEDRGDPEVAANLGLDLGITSRVHLLSSAGLGLRGGTKPRHDWFVYGGLQLLLGPFGPSARPGRSRIPPGSLAEARLLELTDRQLNRLRQGERLSR